MSGAGTSGIGDAASGEAVSPVPLSGRTAAGNPAGAQVPAGDDILRGSSRHDPAARARAMRVMLAEAGLTPLLPAEEALLGDLHDGLIGRVGDAVPDGEGSERTRVRAVLLRQILVGDPHLLHEKGLSLRGAFIVGTLDLQGCRLQRALALLDCRFEAVPVLRGAVIDSLQLDGSVLPGLQGDDLEARGGVSAISAHFTGGVMLTGARLGGSLNCDGAIFAFPLRPVLTADALQARAVLLRGARVEGGLSFINARLTTDLNAGGLVLTRLEGTALNADGVSLGGDVVLRAARVEGVVRMVGIEVGGDLDLTGAHLLHAGRDALQLNRARIEGGFFLRDGARVEGVLDLTGAAIGTLHDDLAGWPQAGDVLLNRCLYSAFIDGPADARSRLDWLARQDPARWNEDFWPQPYEQLAAVFREMGHEEDARSVLIAKERLQRSARRARARTTLGRLVLALKDGVLAVTVLYGRQPLMAFGWLLFFWLLGAGIFGFAESAGSFKPATAVVLRSPEWTQCAIPPSETRFLGASGQMTPGRAAPGQNQLDCFRAQWEAASYPRFNAWMYSLDTLFPVLELEQKTFWRPDPNKDWGRLALAYFYLQSMIGWALSLLAIAGFSGLVKSR